jgi:hypothetical protein
MKARSLPTQTVIRFCAVRSLYLTGILFALVSPLQATEIPPGPVSGNWTEAGSPYLVTGNILLPFGQTLNIQAGVEVRFVEHCAFDINGSLYALGIPNDSILFRPDIIGNYWHGIDFNNPSNDSSRLEYCLITGSDSTGIYCDHASPTFSHCTISGNHSPQYGGGITCWAWSDPMIIHCLIENNYTEWYGGGIYLWQSSPTLSNCTIRLNSCSPNSFGGGIACTSSSHPVITRSIIADNTAAHGGGISSTEFSNPSIINSTIIHNTAPAGSGVYSAASFSYLKNTLVTQNLTSPAVFLDTYQPNQITYGDFYGNPAGDFSGSLPPGLGQLVITNANADSCDIYHNIFFDPRLVEPDSSNYHLRWGSPCIDAGDPTSPLDPDSSIADIGVYWFDPTLAPSEPAIHLSTVALNFGEVNILEFAEQLVTVYNLGNLPLFLQQVSTNNPLFTTNFTPADSVILPGDSLSLSVRFAPLQMGNYSGTLTITNNASPAQVLLTGTAVYPVLLEFESLLWPIYIRPEGGNFDYKITLINTAPDSISFDVWIGMLLPDSTWINPVTGPIQMTLAGYDTLSRIRSQEISTQAAVGRYVYKVSLGSFPANVSAADSFPFTKLPTGPVWMDNFEDGNYTQNPTWMHLSGHTEVVLLDSNFCLDVHSRSITHFGLIQAVVLPLMDFHLEFDIYRGGTSTTEHHTWIGFWPWSYEQFLGFSLFEHDGNSISTIWNNTIQNSVLITSFDYRWQHVAMNREMHGTWNIIWDEGGPNQTTITGEDYFGNSDTLYLWLKCNLDSGINEGACFDNFLMCRPFPTASQAFCQGESQVPEVEAPVPEHFFLSPNFPNPFNAVTTFRFGLPEGANVRLTIYNLLGQEVASLVDGNHPAGYYNATWEAEQFPSGLYLYRLNAGPNITTGKLVLLK